MIKELERAELKVYMGFEKHAGVTVVRLPDNEEIMNKLNEVIRHINNKEHKGD